MLIWKYFIFWIVALLSAAALRWLLPASGGITIYSRKSSRYFSTNIAAFWIVIAVALISFIVLLLLEW